ncbi:leucyl/phenylalanyl-tRNA--protein transferase [Marinomonas colpomeniae]|uniref:Leucyl/phenylalanyl-tRNA--protein transferase n=1 Tax=Marinomonas colpomeniae TaxID=2774408 RepID=A0ABR8NV64_9GAMM|nr:leucyl/phenylalanyl-tRNA--protein transferase [Marinomonas colpomeniae]MBD5769943.1 leucyl/phenylalanyl-tRNA--protein transferase [Marinomonas colpomeniae]
MTDSTKSNEPRLILLSESPYDTPNPDDTLQDPEGLSAVGGDLSSTRLIHLYSKGFFPWFSDPDPILWWHPEQRCVIHPKHFHLSTSLKKSIKKNVWTFSINKKFEAVIAHCSALRADKEGTWISDDIKSAYTELNKLGYAHSIEIWKDGQLAGGFYGVAMGNMFFGESMFSLAPNASKIALKVFCSIAESCGIKLIDCQVESDHLLSLGATIIDRKEFCKKLEQLIPTPDTNKALISIGKKAQNQPI